MKKRKLDLKPMAKDIYNKGIVRASKEENEYFFEIGKELTSDVAEAVAILMRKVDFNEAIWDLEVSNIVLENITMNDDYEGNFETRRSLIYTLRFTAKTYLFGPVADVSKDIIKKVSIGYIAGDAPSTPTRDLTYTVEPRATKNYTNDVETNLSENLDDKSNVVKVLDSSGISANTYIIIDMENMYVESKSGNTLTVVRGADNTVAAEHVSGAAVGLITAADNVLIEMGDDFGFSGS